MRHWTSAEDDYLRWNYLTSSHAAIGKIVGKTERAVRVRCWRLRLRKAPLGWTSAEDAQLRAWYEARRGVPLRLAELSRILSRALPDISERAAHFGLSERTRCRPDMSARLKAGESGWAITGSHPRGMSGKAHSPESRKQMSVGQQKRIANGTHPSQQPWSEERKRGQSERVSARLRTATNFYSRCKHGKREDIGGQFFRSSWEANYARFLNFLIAQGQIAKWEYEPDTFWFEKIRRGVRSYTPDFKITEPSGTIYYVEIKGWMDAKSKTKLKRMAKYYPKIDLRLVGQKAYTELAKKLGGAIPGWERAA